MWACPSTRLWAVNMACPQGSFLTVWKKKNSVIRGKYEKTSKNAWFSVFWGKLMTSFSGESKFLLRSNKLRGWNLRSFPYLSRVFILRSKQLERLSLSVYLASQISDHLLNAFAWFLNDRPQLLPNFSIFQQLNSLLTVLILHFQTFFTKIHL